MSVPVSDSVSSALIHPWNPAGSGSVDVAGLEAWVEDRLRRHREAIGRLLAAEGPRTIEGTLRAYDDAVAELAAVGSLTGLVHSVYPEKTVRDTAQALLQKISQAGVELSLNREVYQALDKIDASGADAATRHYLDRTLLQYRLAGVDKDDATRAKIKELQDQATLTSLNFGRNVQEGGNTVTVEDAAELDGLPADFLEAHQPGEDGKITLTTDFPDYLPVLTFARSSDLRRRMFLAYNTRAYPANRQLLLDLLRIRQEVATILGFAHWADLATADQMMESAANMQAFLDDLDHASKGGAEKEYAMILEFAQSRRAGPEADRCSEPGVLAGAIPAVGVRLRFASGAAVFSVYARRARRAGDGGEAIPGSIPAHRESGCVASVGERLGSVGRRGSWRGGFTSTCIRARARTSGSRRIR